MSPGMRMCGAGRPEIPDDVDDVTLLSLSAVAPLPGPKSRPRNCRVAMRPSDAGDLRETLPPHVNPPVRGQKKSLNAANPPWRSASVKPENSIHTGGDIPTASQPGVAGGGPTLCDSSKRTRAAHIRQGILK